VLSTTQTEIGIGLLIALLFGAIVVAWTRPRLFAVLVWAPIWVPALGVLALGIAIGADFIWDERDQWAFDEISRLDTETRIKNIFGKPDSTESCGENLWWGYDADYLGKNDGRCIKWVRYNHFLSAWAFGYDPNGKVVSKYHYFSE
jgi:hypothetical protein